MTLYEQNIAGVVLSEDTIVTDATLASSMTNTEANFEFSLVHDPDFTSPLLSSRLDSSNVLVVTLAEKIPPLKLPTRVCPAKELHQQDGQVQVLQREEGAEDNTGAVLLSGGKA